MALDTLHTYLAQDRWRALAQQKNLPNRVQGTALFADISGFTTLAETLAKNLGARRGAEELSQKINDVYDVLVTEIERAGGSVISFAGDAITCWFENATPALSAALSMQQRMTHFPDLGLKIVVCSGMARRLVAGDPKIQLLDILAGSTITRLAEGEHLATRGEVLADEETFMVLGSMPTQPWRTAESGARFAPATALGDGTTVENVPQSSAPIPSTNILRSWLIAEVFEREQAGHGGFLTELRPCVALFVRFVGIEFEAAEAEQQLNEFLQCVQSVAQKQGGTLLQVIIGDKGSYLYVGFGALTMHQDEAQRAAQAALELRAEAARFKFLQPLQIGLSQGVMRVGTYGARTRHTYGALGDDVNVAARLMQAAAPGEILANANLTNALKQNLILEPRTALALKGKSEALAVVAVIDALRHKAIRLVEPTYHLPMIGRQAEFSQAQNLLTKVQTGQGQIIGIVAEAGLGKSRLAAHLTGAALRQGFVGYGGACSAAEQNTAYYVWRTIWQAFFEIDPEAEPTQQLAACQETIKRLAPTKQEALPVLHTLLGLEIPETEFTHSLEAKDRKNVLEDLLEQCLRTTTLAEPLLIVLEDLHWLDPLSQDLFRRLAYAAARLPICFVLTYRPPETERQALNWLTELPHFNKVELQNLSSSEAQEFMRLKLAQLNPQVENVAPSEALVNLLSDKAQGNPFYLEELLNYLHDKQIDPYNSQALQSLELPASLHALILSRIDQLSDTQKVTLKVASVLGRLIRVNWLRGFYPELGSAERIRADLDAVARLDLTPLETDDPELMYLFKHIITQEVAYESLPFNQRAELHERLGRFLETTLASAPPLDLLAFHYGRTLNYAKQIEYFRQAGYAAQETYANTAAQEYYRQLLPLLTEPADKIDIYLRLGSVLQNTTAWEKAAINYEAALNHAHEIKNSAQQAQSCYALGVLESSRGNYQKALEWLKQAQTLWQSLESAPAVTQGLGRTLSQIGVIHFRKGDPALTREWIDQALPLLRQAQDRLGEANAIHWLGVAAGYQGNHDEAQPLLKQALAIRQAAGDLPGIAASYHMLFMDAFYHLRDTSAAQRFEEESLKIYQKLGDKLGMASALMNLAGFFGTDNNETRKVYEEALTFQKELGDKPGITVTLQNLGLIDLEEKKYASARQKFNEGLASANQTGNKMHISDLHLNLGLTSLGESKIAEAHEHFRISLPLAQEFGMKYILAYNFVGVAAVALAAADLTRAAHLLGAAQELFRAVGGVIEPVVQQRHDEILPLIKKGLGESAFEQISAEGKALSIDDAIKYALV